MKTYISPLLKSDGGPLKKPGNVSGEPVPIYWLDELLHGGIEAPKTNELGRPLIVLVSGPPGAGKSLLAQQICYNVAVNRCGAHGVEPREALRSGTSLYVTSETSAGTILRNMEAIGLQQTHSKNGKLCAFDILTRSSEHHWTAGNWNGSRQGFPVMWVAGVSPIMDLVESQSDADVDPGPQLKGAIENAWNGAADLLKELSLKAPAIIVVDSLNILPFDVLKAELFNQLITLFSNGDRSEDRPKVLILILDTVDGNREQSAFWEYVADVSIRMSYGYEMGDYFTRQLEIVKGRIQPHALGKHVVKVFPRPVIGPTKLLATDPEGPRPNISSGGVFVFPSVHYVLSVIRSGRQLIDCKPQRPPLIWSARNIPAASGPGPLAPPAEADSNAEGRVDWQAAHVSLNWPTPWCHELVGGGIPVNQCTALIGRRGSRKSYFAYQFLLDGICNGEQTLLISFRDNAAGVRDTMKRIAQAKCYQRFRNVGEIRENPVVIYQRPGYVTPEELFHRVMTAVGEYRPSRVVINSVDQWHASYPLLGHCSILVPALIDFLNTHLVTSMVIGVESGPGGISSTGLTAKAEVVLSFEFRRIPWPARDKRPSNGPAEDLFPAGVEMLTHRFEVADRRDDTSNAKVVVRAVRVPRGAAGFGRAVLEYTTDDPRHPFASLTMIPLAPEYPEGELI